MRLFFIDRNDFVPGGMQDMRHGGGEFTLKLFNLPTEEWEEIRKEVGGEEVNELTRDIIRGTCAYIRLTTDDFEQHVSLVRTIMDQREVIELVRSDR